MPELNFNLHFQPRQWEAFTSQATELLFGGAAFGAKSHFLRAASILWCLEIPGLQVYLFRRVEDELIKNHMDGPRGYRAMLAPLAHAKKVTINELQMKFWNGAQINLCHCKDERHRYRYHGDEIHVLLIDELTTFSELIYRYLRFRVRMVGITLPDKWKAGGFCYAKELGADGNPRLSETPNVRNLFPRVVCASNPGNIGHHWVKRAWALDGAGLTFPTMMPEIEGGMVRQYMHSRFSDNPIGMNDDPQYLARMEGLGDPALVKAMKEGDWNLVAGGFFPEFSLERHVLKAHTLPKEKFSRLFRAADWGSARPFSVGWYGICDEDWMAEGTLGNEVFVPRGAIVRYREWYGRQDGEDNRGIQLPADLWGEGILKRTPLEEQDRMKYDVIDPSAFAENGGPSIAERAAKSKIGGKTLNLRPADNKREPGWDQLRSRLRGDEGIDDPFFFLMDNQPDAIRTLQSVQHDEKYPEDLDTDAEDHAADECLPAGTLIRCARGEIPIERLCLGDEVYTRRGLRAVEAVFATGVKEVLGVALSNGASLTATANHPVWVEGEGFVPVSALRYGGMLRPWTTPTDTGALPDECGAPLAGRSRSVTSSTTSTETQRTTRSRIWNALRRSGIASTIRRTWRFFGFGADTALSPSQQRLVSASSALTPANQHGVELQAWTTRPGGVSGAVLDSGATATARSIFARWRALVVEPTSERPSSSSASNAGRQEPRRTPGQCIAGPRVVSVTFAGRQRVYNLTVREAEEYFANGVLLHNCRYACMSRPRAVVKSSPRKRSGPVPGTYDWLIRQGGSTGISSYNID